MHDIFWRNVATQGAVGYGVAPGTVATCMMIPLIIFLANLDLPLFYRILLAGMFIVFGLYVTARALPFFNEKDPAPIVIDEAVSSVVLCLFLPMSFKIICLAIIFFRFFDIVKPLGIHYLERLPGAAGVMMDDLAAASLSYALIRIIMYAHGGL